MEKVGVNKGVLIGIVAVAALSLLALAFVLGRVSGSTSSSERPSGREVAGRVAAPPVSDPRAQAQPVPAPTPAFAWLTDPANTPVPSLPEQATPQAAPALAPPPAGGVQDGAGSDPERAAVSAYLDAVDHIQPGKMSGDAESTANEMATALTKGDTTGLDKMIRETEATRARLAALTPPPSCAAHYRESLGSVDDALEMLRSLKTAMVSPNPAAQLAAVANRAAALRSRSEALQKEELALRQRYGLTR